MNQAIIDVKSYVQHLRDQIKQKVSVLINEHQITPKLAVILVGQDPASSVYVKQKIKACKACAIESASFYLDKNTSQKQLLDLIKKLNDDQSVNGILVQLPLPKHIDEEKVINTIDPKKDVDGFHALNRGLLHGEQNNLVPCTPLGCIMLLEHFFGDLSAKNALVIGRSRIVGRPMAELLLQKNCTVSIAHSRTTKKSLTLLAQNADIIVVAVGIAKYLKAKDVSNKAIIIDVGINRLAQKDGKSKLVGDADFKNMVKKVKAITPVPGGVGLLTVSCLLLNTYKASCMQHHISSEKII